MKLRLLLFFTILSLCLEAQRDTICPDQTHRIYIGANVEYGFFWAHRTTMDGMVKKHLQGFEVLLSRNAVGNNACDQPFHYPWTGIAVHVIPLGNPEILGTGIGVYPFINFTLGKKMRTVKMHIRLGWGIGYVTKSFDAIENHQNVAIGSHVNACMNLHYNCQWNLNENNTLEFGLGITHFSNGAAKFPNLGVNLPMLSLGFHHCIYENLCTKSMDQKIPVEAMLADRHWRITTFLVGGFNDVDPPGGNRYALMNSLSSLTKRVSRKARFGIGFDLMYSDAIRKRLIDDETSKGIVPDITPFSAIQLGGKVVYEFVVGQVYFPIEVGAYLQSQYDNGLIYSRFGMRYQLNEHLIFNVSLKTHWARAEYFEYGIGWKF